MGFVRRAGPSRKEQPAIWNNRQVYARSRPAARAVKTRFFNNDARIPPLLFRGSPVSNQRYSPPNRSPIKP